MEGIFDVEVIMKNGDRERFECTHLNSTRKSYGSDGVFCMVAITDCNKHKERAIKMEDIERIIVLCKEVEY